jgi:hypothetical protein
MQCHNGNAEPVDHSTPCVAYVWRDLYQNLPGSVHVVVRVLTVTHMLLREKEGSDYASSLVMCLKAHPVPVLRYPSNVPPPVPENPVGRKIVGAVKYNTVKSDCQLSSHGPALTVLSRLS